MVLAAGSADSTTILFYNASKLRNMDGGRITDHDIYYYQNSFHYSTPTNREALVSMILRTFPLTVPDIILSSISINVSTFLPRLENKYDDLPKFIMGFNRAYGLLTLCYGTKDHESLLHVQRMMAINARKS